ncbi:uncharacterized protein B0H18DRAFT_976291 [Fomitopsis serialis]|uniref:uncharacterized protein n=1 Tax=Fomitopsis serialis TaxID=139415 RepID=UPI0020075A0A|nr:uncharacterized protein B0H18DRAFT_976291 [Neoantrodia serialis]KAH9935567.1 hypothetical protein B0H18DRAFT_976291 [Neoantrodia serialis]
MSCMVWGGTTIVLIEAAIPSLSVPIRWDEYRFLIVLYKPNPLLVHTHPTLQSLIHHTMKIPAALIAATALALATPAFAGPIAYGICQTGCNTVVVACYAAAGVTFGTVIAAPATPAVILGCNAALGTCSAACATIALFAPTP